MDDFRKIVEDMSNLLTRNILQHDEKAFYDNISGILDVLAMAISSRVDKDEDQFIDFLGGFRERYNYHRQRSLQMSEEVEKLFEKLSNLLEDKNEIRN